MDISREEQRILHPLAQGGKILLEKDERKTIREIICLTRDGSRYMACDFRLFRNLKQKRQSHLPAVDPTWSLAAAWIWCGRNWITDEISRRRCKVPPVARPANFGILACQKSPERGTWKERQIPSLGFAKDLARAKSRKILSLRARER
jgi:uncharacterized protein YjhX (UPF0386 family)